MSRFRYVPAALLTAALALLAPICSTRAAEPAKDAPKPKKSAHRSAQMDYGPFMSQSFINEPGGKFDNTTGNWAGSDVTPRGVALKLQDDWNAGMIFDTATLRMSAAWIGAPLKLVGTAFDGAHGPSPTLAMLPIFQTPQGPGWADASGSFKDPRANNIAPLPPAGPLPAEWAKFKGLYRHGDQVVLSYTVGKTNVLELGSLEIKELVNAFGRTIRLEGGDAPLVLMVAEAKGKTGAADGNSASLGDINVSIIDPPAGAKLEVTPEGQMLYKIPALKGAVSFKVLIAHGGEAGRAAFTELAKASAKPIDVTTLTKGGPAKWTADITTVGVLGKDDAAYTSDTLTIPYENPYKSWMRLGGMDFFSDGTRAAVSTWSGDVWIVSGIDEKLEKLTWKRFATGIHHPLGLKIVDDVIYTVGNSQITRLHDLNKDGEADFYECFNNDWQTTTAFHAFCFDLHTDPQGNFIFAMGAPVRSGGQSFHKLTDHHGTILRVSKDGKKLDVYATGVRAPNGIGVGPDGQVTSGDNQGTFVPACPLNWIAPGSFNGVVDSAHRDGLKTSPSWTPKENWVLEKSETPKPLCWFPMDVDNSGGGQVWVTSDKWGPFKGELLHMSYGKSSLYKVLKETVDGQIQGGVAKIPVTFTSSAMRARFNAKDGQLYVAGLTGWQSNGAKDGGFNRVRYTGKPVYIPSELHAAEKGVKITFPCSIDEAAAADVQNWAVEVWNYKWTQNYGSPDVSAYPEKAKETADPAAKDKKKSARDPLTVKSAKLAPDGKSVFLEIEEIKPVMQMKITYKIKAADGAAMNGQITNTIHKLGK